MSNKPEEFAVALGALEQELDWPLLGQLHCHGGGQGFFSPGQIEAQREAGLLIAGALGEQLMGTGGRSGRSLYVGMAVGEIVPVLMEHLVLGREVVLVNLDNGETAELNRAFAAVQSEGLKMPRVETQGLAAVEGVFDHGWMVSVLNDPEAFPALHDELYGREGQSAVGGGVLAEDLAAAKGLAEEMLSKLASASLLSTTDEELPVWRPLLARGGWRMRASEQAILTAVVGDPLRFLRLSRGRSGAI